MVGQLLPLANSLIATLSNPTVLMTIIVAASLLAALNGWMSWRTTGLILILGAVYAQLAEVFGPEAAATIIASNVVSFVFGRLFQMMKQKSGLTMDNVLNEK